MPLSPLAAIVAVLGTALPTRATEAYFVPSHRLPGIGAGRHELTAEALDRRTDAMIQAQTFSIMREPQAVAGARRIWGDDLQRLFQDAGRMTGFPASVLQAIAYLESWGLPNAESPAGPRGIMQISEATGKRMGLRIVYSVRHRVTKTKTAVRNKHGKLVYRTVRRRETYTVLERDDRLRPERAIPAAARYLASLEQRLGGRDWAIWAYHCGEGCIVDIQSMARAARGPSEPPASVAAVFFGCSPAWNRALYQAIQAQMARDYSPTYWFRVMRAQQLLRLYLDDPVEFQDLVDEYKNRAGSAQRAPDRLSVWLKPQDLLYEAHDAVHNDGGKLVRAPDDPGFFGYRVAGPVRAENENGYPEALPSTLGTLAYIAFETRRLHQALRAGEVFVPLDVTALFVPVERDGSGDRAPGARAADHASGQVFDISVAALPNSERECLRFVLDDLGWSGNLGFIEEGRQTLHIGCAPSARDFFAQVFEDEVTALRERNATVASPAVPAPEERR